MSMDKSHMLITGLSMAILGLSIYIFVKKQQKKEHFVSPLYNDTGMPDYEGQSYAKLGY